MKIELEQKKLMEILDCLSVDGIYPFSIITVKDGALYSIQTDKDGFTYRYVRFEKDNFKEISDKEEAVKIDVEKIKGFASLRAADDVITLEYPSPISKNKIQIRSKRFRNNIAVTKIDDDEVKRGLPFKLKNKIPYINKGQTALDTHITISLKSFRQMVLCASKHGTEFYRFKIGKDRKLEILVGDINKRDDFTSIEPNCTVNNVNEELDVTFTKGVKELAKVLSRDIDIHLRSNMPAWITELSHNHKFGVLISPVRGE